MTRRIISTDKAPRAIGNGVPDRTPVVARAARPKRICGGAEGGPPKSYLKYVEAGRPSTPRRRERIAGLSRLEFCQVL